MDMTMLYFLLVQMMDRAEFGGILLEQDPDHQMLPSRIPQEFLLSQHGTV
jgi:hypothetical protein